MHIASVFYRKPGEPLGVPWEAARPYQWAVQERVVQALKKLEACSATGKRPVTRYVPTEHLVWKIYLVEI